MKELIYLDTEFLHSFIAQKEGGLPTSADTETQEQRTETDQKEEGYHSRSYIGGRGKTGDVNIPGIYNSPSAGIDLRFEPGKKNSESFALSELEAGKEIISKQLHDNALEEFEKHADENGILNNVDPYEELHIGQYIRMKHSFGIVDFSFLQSAISQQLIDVMLGELPFEIKLQKEQIDANDNLNKGQKNLQKQNLDKKLNDAKNPLMKTFGHLENAFSYLSNILPTESFLKMANTISPLKDEFLRETSKNLYFKYANGQTENQVSLIGKVTREMNLSKQNEELNPSGIFEGLSQMTDSIDTLFGEIAVAEEGDFIISPIAIYFE